jgi:DNA-binding NtrC family response regulator
LGAINNRAKAAGAMPEQKTTPPEPEAARILVVDDEEVALKALRRLLEKDGHKVSTFSDPVRALERLRQEPCDLVLSDLCMPHLDGLEFMAQAKRLWPGLEVILITGYASVPNALKAVSQGAFHYLAKPLDPQEVRLQVGKALELIRLRRQAKAMEVAGPPLMIGSSPGMVRLQQIIGQIAPTDCNVLIEGPSGTGKELAARTIHDLSPRRSKPFMAFNCGAFTEELIANELFGHEKGAFTGADQARAGLLEAAQGGTLFLDEIGDMPLSMQVKLLRVLQERELMRVGGTRAIPLDVRVVAATARDLKAAAAQGAFRQDLYFRLNVVTLTLPPLSERRGDIPLLAYHFLYRLSRRMGKEVKRFSPEAMALLEGYAYPGNVRELENIVERAVALASEEVIRPSHLPPDLAELTLVKFHQPSQPLPTLEDMERDYVKLVLQRCGGSRTQAARLLGIDRTALWRRMKKYDLA